MNPLAGLGDELLSQMLVYGYPVLGLVLLLSAVGVPLPASLVATLAGTLLAEGELDVLPTVVIALGACVIGDLLGFGIGRVGGRELARRHGRWIGVRAARLQQAETLFERWAGPTLLVSRSLLAIIGSAINLLAGASRLSVPVFLGYTVVARLIWVLLFVGMGYIFAGSAEVAADFASSLSGVVGILALMVFGALASR